MADAKARSRVGSAVRLAALGIVLTVAVVIVIGLTSIGRPAPTSGASDTAAATVNPSVNCMPEAGPLPAMLASDPCPAAIVAVELAVAPVRLPIERIVIEPGPFYCDVLWPGVGSPAVCFGVTVRPGQFMHGWVAFRDTAKVAAVMLGLDLPDELDAPGATRPPWHATLVTVEVPPNGWVMP